MPDPKQLLQELQTTLAKAVKLSDCQPSDFTPELGIKADAGLGVSLGPALMEIRQAINSMEGIKGPQVKFSLGGLSKPRTRVAPKRGRGHRSMCPSI